MGCVKAISIEQLLEPGLGVVTKPARLGNAGAVAVTFSGALHHAEAEDATRSQDAADFAHGLAYGVLGNVQERGVGPNSIQRAVWERQGVKITQDGSETAVLAELDHGQ